MVNNKIDRYSPLELSQNPFISIIIPVRNAARTLPTTFNYLFRVDYPRDKMEIIIADGGSSDDTVSVIRHWQKDYSFIKLVEIPNCPSPGFARNKALKVVKGEFIFFTDGDCAPASDWIWKILKVFSRDENIAAVGGEVHTLRVDKDNVVEAWCEHFGFNMVSPRYGFIKEGYFPDFPKDPTPADVAGHRAYFFGTCNVAYRKEALDVAGAYFWERPTGEDMELSLRTRKHGYKFYFAPDADVKHMHRANLKQLLNVWASYGRAHPVLIEKYIRKHRLDIILQFLKSKPVLSFPFPIRGFIYLGNLQLGILCLILSLVSGLAIILGNSSAGLLVSLGIFVMGFVLFSFNYFKACFDMQPRRLFLSWCAMKFLTNIYFIRGGLEGIFKHKILCIEPSF